MKNWRGLELIAALPIAIPLLLASSWPRWVVMWLICGGIFAAAKWLTWRRACGNDTSVARQLGYLFAWPGLDADRFLSDSSTINKPRQGEWAFAAGKTLLGVALLLTAARFVPVDEPLVRGWVAMFGLIFLLHFGSFHLLSCAWRAAGVAAEPLMDWPIAATSLAEFWGRRWNEAFRDLTHRFLFRPLLPRYGATLSLFAVFLLSGLIHELAITVPAGGGFGGPTCFFLLQACGLLLERSPFGKRLGLAHGWRGWLYSATLLVLPVGLLFPPVFVRQIIHPMLVDIGSLL